MFAIGLHYLCGWVMASDQASFSRAEWPPHPDRVFMALAAAHFETDGDTAEREALRWLEQQGAPALSTAHASRRAPVVSYVPVNDVVAPRIKDALTASHDHVQAGVELLAERRSRQPRQFPVALPDDPVVHVIWPDSQPDQARLVALRRLCEKVTRVGHSASLVQAWVEAQPPPPNLVPSPYAALALRVPGPGRLAALQARFQAGLRPTPGLSVRYGESTGSARAVEVPRSVFDANLFVLRRVEGRALGLESTLRLTQALRGAVMQACPEPVPEWVSGHKPEGGRRSENPHLAFLPLAHVGRRHADGHLLGVALVLPRAIPSDEAARCLGPILSEDEFGCPGHTRIFDSQGLDWVVELDSRGDRPQALHAHTWTAAFPQRPASRWATVTPIALDRHPKGPDKWSEIERSIGDACQRIGLPEPVHVVSTPTSMLAGVPPARDFPRLQRKSDDGKLHHTHAALVFPEPVMGPLLLGAGRYRGYGLCRPLSSDGDL